MTLPTIALGQVVSPDEVAIVRELFWEYSAAIGTDLEFQGFSAELAALPGPYVPPHGALIIASIPKQVIGCVAMRPIDTLTGEMKRLYIRPEYRGRGLGRHLVGAAAELARVAGYRELRLDTLENMATAQALYRQLGFVEVEPYHNAYVPGTRFYALKLAAQLPQRAPHER